MNRILAILMFAVVLVPVSSGQAPAPLPTAAEQLHMLQTNRSLLEQLLDRSVAISDSETSLARAEACQAAAQTLTGALKATADNGEPGRLAELADHLGTLWAEGLAPVLEQTRREVRPGSPDYERLERLEKETAADVENVTEVLKTAPAGIPARIQAIRDRLQRQ